MRKIARTSLRVTSVLQVLVSSVLVLALLVAGVVIAGMVSDALARTLTEKNEAMVDSIAMEIESLLSGYETVLTMMADPGLLERNTVKRLMSLNETFEAIAFMDSSGIVTFSTNPEAELGFDYSRRDLFVVPKSSGEAFFSSISASAFSYAPSVTLSLPVSGGVIMARLNLSVLSENVRELTRDSGDIIAVVDGDGYYIAHTNGGKVFRRETITGEGIVLGYRDNRSVIVDGYEGRQALVSRQRIERCGWTVMMARSTELLFRPVQYIIAVLVAVLAICAVAIFVVTYAILGIVKRDIDVLGAYATSLASGDYSTPREYGGFREFVELAGKFRLMADEVDEREQRLTHSLREKEVLLREVHHRVKNNLQLVESLLSLQSGFIDDEASLRVFGDSRSRIDVLARVHEMLYQSKNLSRIPFDDYVRLLVESLSTTYSLHPPFPSFSIDLDPVSLDIDKAIPCGLIVNEIVTNALKYGQDPRTDVFDIRVSMRKADAEMVTLEIVDGGPGLPPGFDVERTDSLGMKLITSLATQLGGSWELSGAKGVRWTIVFPLV